MAQAQVWTLDLAGAPDLSHLLSEDERRRAARFVIDTPRRQFVAARGGLRLVLGQVLGVAPQAVAFRYEGNGKPCVEGLHFNVSHSHQVAVIAVSHEVEVGVDVECVRPRDSWPDMARRYFTPREVAAICSVEAFYHTWVRKEAFLKALGLGLSHGLERFAVSVPPDDPARILHVDGDEAAGASWSLHALAPAEGYVGALAAREALEVVCGRWGW